MMGLCQTISHLLTNELRFVLGLYLVARFTDLSFNRKALALSVLGGYLVALLSGASLPASGIMAAEILITAAVAWYCRREQLRRCLFLIFFYEVGAGLWDFLLSAGLGVLFRSERFLAPHLPEHLAGIWLARLVTAGLAVLLAKRPPKPAQTMRLASIAALLGLFGAVTLSEQTLLPLNEDQLGSWVILAMVLLFATLFYRVNRQREMELEIARLKQEQAEILERDYQTLRQTYSHNAKLYHDLHNHIEVIHQCLSAGDVPEAARYCEALRSSVREISQTVWTGDRAIDCLISSKLALAEQNNIQTQVNIEYPHHTNIRSVDLTTILGNLLDNALEAAGTAPKQLRFLHLTVRRINDMVVIKISNGCAAAPRHEAGVWRTSKADKAFHGWGLKSVRTAAERYDGAFSATYSDGIFQAVVTLSFRPVQPQ